MGVVIRQSIKGTLVNYTGAFIGFLTTFFIITDLLTAEEIGLTRVLVDAGALFAGLAQLGTNASVIRYYPFFKDPDHKDHGFFFWTLVVPFIGCCIYGLLFVFFKDAICHFFEDKSPLFVDYYWFALPLGFFLLYMAVFESNANVLMRIVVPRFVREVVIRVLSLTTYILYAYDVVSFHRFIFLFCLVYGAATLLDIIYLMSLKKISFIPDFKHITRSLRNDYLKYTAFTSTQSIISVLAPTISTFFVSAKMGLSHTGIYTIAMYVAMVIEIPYRSLGAISTPLISQASKDNDMVTTNRLGKSISLHQFLVSSFLFFLIWINIDLFYQILPNGEVYAAGRWVVFILGIHRILSTSCSISFSVLGYSKYYYYFLYFAGILTVSAICFNNWLIPVCGIAGAALATLSANVLYFSLLMLFIYHRLRFAVFSWGQLKILLIVLCLFGINAIWQTVLSPFILAIPLPDMVMRFIEALIRTSVLLGMGIYTLYRLQISTEVNRLIQQILQRIFRK